jgi:DNA-binding NtrC family response regulator
MALDRILIVDDTAIIRKSLEERLRGKRYAVSTAGSIAEAEKRLAANSFDLIFLDMELPDGDGRVFIERLSHNDNRPLVVMITANGSIESVVEEKLGVRVHFLSLLVCALRLHLMESLHGTKYSIGI